MATIPLVYGRGRTSNPWRKTLHFGTRIRKDVVVEKGATSQEKSTTANGPFCVARNPSGFVHNLRNLLRPLELVPASGERVVPTEWRVRTVLGDCMLRARVNSNSSASVPAMCADQ